MDYKKIYDQLVEKCKVRGLDKSALDGYFEKHHIVPRCMDGTDNEDNLVLFTPREHVIAHRLLWKSFPDNYSLMWAYTRTVNSHKGILTSREVEKAKIAKSEFMSNREISEETKEKIRNTLLGRKVPRDVVEKTRLKNTGKKRSKETSERLRKKRQELVANGWTMPDEAREKIGNFFRGKKRSPEAIEKSRLAQIGKKISDEQKQILSEYQRSLKPWEKSSVKARTERKLVWLNADIFYSFWIASSSPGSWAFSTSINNNFYTNYSVSHFQTVVNLFRDGWIPHEDETWAEWRDALADCTITC